MTADDLQSAAHRIVEAMVRDFPTEAATIGALVLTEIMAAGLHGGGDPDATDAFVAAINWKLGEIAVHHGADRAWQLDPVIRRYGSDDQPALLAAVGTDAGYIALNRSSSTAASLSRSAGIGSPKIDGAGCADALRAGTGAAWSRSITSPGVNRQAKKSAIRSGRPAIMHSSVISIASSTLIDGTPP